MRMMSNMELGGIAEIADEAGVPRSTASMWHNRRKSTGFPEAVVALRAGPVFDMTMVRDWLAAKGLRT